MYRTTQISSAYLWILASLQLMGARHVIHRDKRSASVSGLPESFSLQRLRNASTMTCNDAMTMHSVRMVQLDNHQMISMFEGKGGNYVQGYMAATQEEALENFPNLLTMPTMADGNTDTFTAKDNYMAKKVIMEDMHKLSLYVFNNPSTITQHQPTTTSSHISSTKPASTPSTVTSDSIASQSHKVTKIAPATVSTAQEVINNKTNVKTSHQPHVLSTSSTSDQAATTTISAEKASIIAAANANMTSSVSNAAKLYTTTKEQLTSASMLGTNSINKTTSPVSATRDTIKTVEAVNPHMTIANPHTTTVNPEVLIGINQLQQYVQGSGYNTSSLDKIWRDANTTLHPTTLLGLTAGNARRKRNADGSYSQEEFCQMKGSLTDDHKFVHLCSMCAATTKLPEDYFPRYINEVVCKTGDSDCFTIAGSAHGQCKQRTFALNMMQRQPGHCLVVTHGGETLVMENWQLAPKVLRVSCECTLNKLSVFRQYVAQDVPVG